MPTKFKDKKRSPLKKGILHYAGQSLDERIEDVLYSEILVPIIVIIFICVLAVLEWVRLYFNIPNMSWPYTIVALAFIIYYGIKIIKNIRDIRNMGLGRDGECIVGESLEELRAMGYKVYHDVVGDSFNIDHILIGPAGVFTIETKTYRKQIGNNSQIYYDGVKIRIDGLPDSKIKDPIKQAKGQMYWLECFISDNVKMKVKVKPVVVFPGWYINQNNGGAEVWVLNEKALPTFIKNSETVLSQEQIDLITATLEGYIRNN